MSAISNWWKLFYFQTFLDVSKKKGQQQPPSLIDKFGYNFDREGLKKKKLKVAKLVHDRKQVFELQL